MKLKNRMIKTSVFAMGLAAFGMVSVSTALADHKQGRHYTKHHYNNHHYKRHYKRNDHWRTNVYVNYGYYYGGHRHRHYHHRPHHRRHHHGGNGGEVALGILTGGLLFYALTNSQRNNDYDRHYDRKIYVRERPVYVQPPQQQWTRHRPQQPRDKNCLQVREYQTTITVGGKTVPAYGQSCLQPDGSWKLGPAIPEPEFN